MVQVNQLTEAIIGSAIEVHRELGPGLLEHSYEVALHRELELRGLRSLRQVILPISYKGVAIEEAYRLDLLVENRIVVELKTVEALKSIHTAQLLTYLRMSGKELGLLINFHVPVLHRGIRRIVNNLPEPL